MSSDDSTILRPGAVRGQARETPGRDDWSVSRAPRDGEDADAAEIKGDRSAGMGRKRATDGHRLTQIMKRQGRGPMGPAWPAPIPIPVPIFICVYLCPSVARFLF